MHDAAAALAVARVVPHVEALLPRGLALLAVADAAAVRARIGGGGPVHAERLEGRDGTRAVRRQRRAGAAGGVGSAAGAAAVGAAAARRVADRHGALRGRLRAGVIERHRLELVAAVRKLRRVVRAAVAV